MYDSAHAPPLSPPSPAAVSEGLELVNGELPDDDELVIALKQLKTELEQLIQTGGGEAAEAQ